MSFPVVYTAEPAELRAALERIHERVAGLKQPRLYHLAIMLTILVRQGKATSWASWETPPPLTAKSIGRGDLVRAMWDLFGTQTSAVLEPTSSMVASMRMPARVLLDPFYGANPTDPRVRVVSDRTIASDKRQDSAALAFDHPAWVWSTAAGIGTASFAEYNPVNSLNQQNGVGCALPTSEAVALAARDPKSVYAVARNVCARRQNHAGGEPTCAINGRTCGGQGDGAARDATKPRLLAPAVPDGAWMVLPGTMDELVAAATLGGTRKLPRATDLAFVASWCHTNGNGGQNANRLLNLFGPSVQLLTSTT